MRKRRTRYTVEYEDRIELCGSYERAKERFNELTEQENPPERIYVYIDDELALTFIDISVKIDNSQKTAYNTRTNVPVYELEDDDF